MAKESKELTKSGCGWVANFTLVGKATIGEKTFQLDQESKNSSYIYSRMSLGVDCGPDCGTVYAQNMGGYSPDRDNMIYVHGKKDDGNDDFKQQFVVDWDDRFNDEVLESVGKNCFITVGLEVDSKGKTFYKNFLSQYDAIAYVQEHLKADMVIKVKGDIAYRQYNGNTSMEKNITYIAITKAEPADFRAEFKQTFLLTPSCTDFKTCINKDKHTLSVTGYVLENSKEFLGVDISEQYEKDGKMKSRGRIVPYPIDFEFEYSDDATKAGKAMKMFFDIKKGVRQITFLGLFKEGGAVVQATYDDLTDDIKALIDCGVITEEDALAECSDNGSRERRMVVIRPDIKRVKEEGADKSTGVVQIFDKVYSEEDLEPDYIVEARKKAAEAEDEEDDCDEDLPFPGNDDDEDSATSDDDWMAELGI